MKIFTDLKNTPQSERKTSLTLILVKRLGVIGQLLVRLDDVMQVGGGANGIPVGLAVTTEQRPDVGHSSEEACA